MKLIQFSQDIWQLAFYFKLTTWELYIAAFYLLVLLIGLVVLDIFYVSYSFTRKKFSFMWPLYALRVILCFFITFLFLPILDYFIGVMGCLRNPITGKLVHHAFTEVECFTPIHIFHSIMSSIFAVFFIVLAFVVGLCYFECKPLTKDVTARWNARWNFIYNFYEMIMIFMFAFFYGEEYDFLFLFAMLVGSAVIFFKYYIDYPYYSSWFGVFWATLININLWTVIMAWFAKLIEEKLFSGTIYAYLIGLVFIIVITIQSRDHRMVYLLKDVNKFHSGREVITKINYLYKLLSLYSDDLDSLILIDGFFEIHKHTCQREECPLRVHIVKPSLFTLKTSQKIETMKVKNLFGKGNKGNGMMEHVSSSGRDGGSANPQKDFEPKEKKITNEKLILMEKRFLLIELMHELFTIGVKNFPSNSMLRISYGYFLKDIKNMKKQALQELSEAEKSNAFFDEDFLIYQFRKNIEDEVENEGINVDILSEIATQSYLLQLQKNIEKSAFLYMDFWSQLMENTPDITFLSNKASKISLTVTRIEEHWKKLNRINPNMLQAYKLYVKFRSEVLNERELNDEFVKNAKLRMAKEKNSNILTWNEDGENLSSIPDPTVIISGEATKIGLISQTNLATSNIFGYTKNELLNRNIKVLMPKLFADVHDQLIQNFLDNPESEGGFMNREFFSFGKGKHSYIFPLIIKVRLFGSDTNDVRFIGSLRPEIYFRNTAFLICDSKGLIEGISASCYTMLGIDEQNIKSGITVEELSVKLWESIDQFANSKNEVISVQIFDLKTNTFKNKEFLCGVKEISFLGQTLIGYTISFQNLPEKKKKGSSKFKKSKQVTSFEFRYDKSKLEIVGELYPSMGSTQSDVFSGASKTDEGACGSYLDTSYSNLMMRPDYGDGIVTQRLQDGVLKNIPAEENPGFYENQEVEQSMNNTALHFSNLHVSGFEKRVFRPSGGIGKDEELVDVSDLPPSNFQIKLFKSTDEFQDILKNKVAPHSIKTFKVAIFITCLLFLVLSVLDYVLTPSMFSITQGLLKNVRLTNSRLETIQQCVLSLLTLSNLNARNILEGQSSFINEEYLFTRFDALMTEFNSIEEELASNIIDYGIYVDGKMEKREISIVYFDNGESVVNQTVSQIVDSIESRFNSISQKELSFFEFDQSEIYFLTENLIGVTYNGLVSASKDAQEYFQERAAWEGDLKLKVFLVVVFMVCLSGLILFLMLTSVQRTKKRTLKLFLDIPEKSIKEFYDKCEKFVSKIQISEEDELLSQDNDFDDTNSNPWQPTMETLKTSKKPKKKAIESGKNNIKVFFRFTVPFLTILVYFGVALWLSKTFHGNLGRIGEEMSHLSTIDYKLCHLFNFLL